MIIPVVIISGLLSISAAGNADESYPAWSELEPLLGKEKDSREVAAVVKKYQLKEATKGPSGSFGPDNHSFSLLYRRNRISTIIVDVLPPPKGYGEPDWTAYQPKLPFGIQKADKRAEFVMRFGRSKSKSGTIFEHKKFEIWAHFRENDGVLSELFISPLNSGAAR